MAIEPYRSEGAVELATEDERVREALAPYVLAGEELLWVGRPKQGAYLARTERGLVFMMAFTTVMTTVAAIVSREGLLGPFGVAMNVAWAATFWWRNVVTLPRARSKTYYAITNRRALAVVADSDVQINSLDLARADHARLVEHGDGTGTMSFGTPRHDMHAPVAAPLVLERIVDPRVTFNRLRAAQDASTDAQRATKAKAR